MIDTCQANTMYSKFYSPNIIATGSSAIDQSSYSHHADSDVGVAVIDRYTYYNLVYLETQVTEPNCKKTLGDLFSSYDKTQIHSDPGVRWDLFSGGEEAGRQRLLMDFFGNVQNVEVGEVGNSGEWDEDLLALGRKISELQAAHNSSRPVQRPSETARFGSDDRLGASRVRVDEEWMVKKSVGALVLAACSVAWMAASWLDSTGRAPASM
jgi:phosphatidylinositol glycan class K